MKANEFEKVVDLMKRLRQLTGDVNGADVALSFTDGRAASVPMDKNLAKGYLINEQNVVKAELRKLGVEVE